MTIETIDVIVAVIERDGDVLVSRRKEGQHLPGLLEFPGGKIEAGELQADALRREIQEELGIQIMDAERLIRVSHDYDDRSVVLNVWRVLSFDGVAAGREGQEIRWMPVDELDPEDFPAADRPIIDSIRLPRRSLITGEFLDEFDFIVRLRRAISEGIGLIQCRFTLDHVERIGAARLSALYDEVENICRASSVCSFINAPFRHRAMEEHFHLNRHSRRYDHAVDLQVVSASCHDADELEHAVSSGAKFVYLSPVKETKSHPEAEGLGWEQFASLVETVNVPVYALGGLGDHDLETAIAHGAHGVAGIGSYWER